MEKESDVLRIVKEDILEVLREKNGEVPLLLIEPEIRVSRSFISKAIRELEKEDLIRIKKNLACLTEKGTKKAETIIKKHLILENYFRKIRSKKEAYKAASILEHYVSMEVIDNIKKLSTLKKEGVSLTEFKQKEGLIADTIFDVGLFERIISMGIFPGEKIEITNKLPNSIVVEIENKKFALAKKIASGIKVLKI
ncbi:MAG: FeoA domain-containing protein [Candidatus Omnitrophica bacterium]|nr:FeoA domain-containing protein [Candidatus Omnitrophota bacterium]